MDLMGTTSVLVVTKLPPSAVFPDIIVVPRPSRDQQNTGAQLRRCAVSVRFAGSHWATCYSLVP